MSTDFTNCSVNRFKTYAGANGAKLCIEYQGKPYMLKFPAEASERFNISYKNNTVTEYLGCHIFNILGIPAQETILGTYTRNDKKKVVVACKDLTSDGMVISDFISLKNTIIDSTKHGAGTELDSILEAIERQTIIDPYRLKTFFWDMFIVDAYIGNLDRHNGNWGLLTDAKNRYADICPVFDCGSSFFPASDFKLQQNIMSSKNDFYYHMYVIPRSAITINGKKLKYYDFLCSNKYPDCTHSLLKIANRIDTKFTEIQRLVNDLDDDLVSPVEKDFYLFLVAKRKECLIDKARDIILENYPEYKTQEQECDDDDSVVPFGR